MTDSKTPVLVVNNRLYDFAKRTTMIYLPALGTLYFALAGIWNFPKPEEVVGSITALVTFLGVVLHISNNQYQNSDASTDGTIDVSHNEAGAKVFQLGLNGDPENLDQQDKVVFKVNKK